MNEMWVQHFDSEAKHQFKQWKHVQSTVKFRKIDSAGKVMASVFWKVSWMSIWKGESVTGQYYAQQLQRLKQAIIARRKGKWNAGVRLLYDNAPTHRQSCSSHGSQIKTSTDKHARCHHLNKDFVGLSVVVFKCKFELITFPTYSPDLAPSDYYLFPQLKLSLKGAYFWHTMTSWTL